MVAGPLGPLRATALGTTLPNPLPGGRPRDPTDQHPADVVRSACRGTPRGRRARALHQPLRRHRPRDGGDAAAHGGLDQRQGAARLLLRPARPAGRPGGQRAAHPRPPWRPRALRAAGRRGAAPGSRRRRGHQPSRLRRLPPARCDARHPGFSSPGGRGIGGGISPRVCRQPGPSRRDRRHPARLDAAGGALPRRGGGGHPADVPDPRRRAALGGGWRLLLSAPPHPSRAVPENLADLRAAVAANRRGAAALQGLAAAHGRAAVLHFMRALEDRAAARLAEALARLPEGEVRALERLDDGSPIAVRIELFREGGEGRAVLDFAGSGRRPSRQPQRAAGGGAERRALCPAAPRRRAAAA